MTLRSAFLERPLGWRRGASLLAFALALLPRSAVAQALPIDLTWQAPPECPGREAVLARARSLLGNKATKVDQVRAEGTIQKTDDRYELTLLIDERGQGGERKVWARQCDELSGAAAIALVLLLTSGNDSAGGDSDGNASGSDSAEAAKPPPVTTPPVTPAPPSQEPSPPSGADQRWRFLLDAPQFALGIGPLPKPSLGLGVGVGLQGRSWSVRLLGQWFASQAVAAPVQPYGADVKRASAGLWACWDLRHDAWSLSPCLQGSAAHLRATGYGPFLRPSTRTETSFGVGVGAIGRLQPLDWFALMVGAGVQMELNRPIILLGTVGTVRQLAPFSATVQLGPEWIF